MNIDPSLPPFRRGGGFSSSPRGSCEGVARKYQVSIINLQSNSDNQVSIGLLEN